MEGSGLVGRWRELRVLRSFADQAAVDGAALLLTGDAGIGKTALLDAVGEYALTCGATVVRVIGTELEGRVGYASLNQALYPLLTRLDDLPTAHQQALGVALGLGDGPPPDRLRVANATTALLRSAAATAPLLLIVDDVQWIDRASAGVLSFVARRLDGSRAGFLAACRTGEDQGYFDRAGLHEYDVQPLADEDAAELLGQRFPDLHRTVASRLLHIAQGNPLALLELPRALSASQRTAAEPLPAVLPLGHHLQRYFAARVMNLPPATRAFLLMAAVDDAGELAVLLRAGAGSYGIEDLGPAERDQLVELDGRRLRFRHPLIRSAVVAAMTSIDRRAAHRALAGVLADEPERRAVHLGEATIEPDEDVARMLEEAAGRLLGRGDHLSAIALLTRAAELSPGADARGRRLAESAFLGAESMGDFRRAANRLEAIRRAGGDAAASLHYASAAALVMITADGHVDTAHRLLVAAIEGSPDAGDAGNPEIVNALWTLALLCFVGGRSQLWDDLYVAMARLTDGPPDLLRLTLDLFADPARTGVAALPRLDAALRSVHRETDLDVVQNLAGAAMYADRLAELREPLWRIVLQGRAGGPARKHLVSLFDLCVDDFHRGHWDEAAEFAAEGLSVSEDRAGGFFSWYPRYHQALLAAVRGRFGAAQALVDQIVGWAGPRGVGTARAFAHHALVLADIGRGDYEAAYRHAAAISPAGVLASHVPHALWMAMDLVEAAVRTNRRAEAAAHVSALRAADVATLSPRLAILVEASAGIAAVEDDDAWTHFEKALTLPTVEQWPFDVARIRLCHGERLRRARSVNEAQVQLEAAVAAFTTLGADPWTARAERELRATGLGAPAKAPRTAALTAQEVQIARLAAAGLTNKDIAARLYLSPRTVGGHLYRIFPKLGITTRAALRDALGPDD
ncbi:AAA family ATPase [Kribbella sp. HUAS MG21]|uniref:AAA family ATPase n=1 Tax=Kribbella sp. HUAS MG21 TaxID=3160966 RepID=A0AAU7TCS2_9ACTN